MNQSNQSISIADEIGKLAKLKEEGIITEEEFKQMKRDPIRKNDLGVDVLKISFMTR